MSLFQSSVLKKYLKNIDTKKLDEAWDVFTKHFHDPDIQENIQNSKEEQYQGEFLIDLFVNVLGYTKSPSPNFNLTTELKNEKDSKKADGAILKDDYATAVIELKGMNTTDLGKIENQAFGYKNNQTNCEYVIISNFQKVRFYVDNAIHFLEFDLFTLTKEEFEVLWVCLEKESLLSGIPKKIKDQSLVQEESVSKQLYKDYSLFRKEIFANLVQNNPEVDKMVLFQKTQKLLDRFLFVFFAEDRGLLPPNSIREILKQWKQLIELDEKVPLYSRFKKYFGYMDKGFKGKKHDVFAYNGGLFRADNLLDSIKIDDEVLYDHCAKLSDYDFESEVDVNILGHIFENSLNELEEMQAEINGEEIDKSKTKRKKDGVFYTPKYITKYIVDNTVGKLCTEKKEELGIVEDEYFKNRKGRKKDTIAKLDEKLKQYRAWLLQLTICDPACGSGAFLNQALEFLLAEHAYIDELETKLHGGGLILPVVPNDILENNLFGVDLNAESVEIAKLALWLRTAKPNRKLNSLNNNIKCGNSLIDNPEVAGDKAFNWEKEFPQVFEKGGFDVVIGNPPYVRQELIKDQSIYLQEKYETHSGKADLYVFFFEKATKLVKNNGYIGFISSGKFLEASYGQPLCNFLSEKTNFKEIINFGDLEVFEGISAYPLIFIGINTPIQGDYRYAIIDNLNFSSLNQEIKKVEALCSMQDFISNNFKIFSKETASVLKRIKKNSFTFTSLYPAPTVGIKTGFNDGYLRKSNTKYSFGKGIKKYSPVVTDEILFPYNWNGNEYKLVLHDDEMLKPLLPEKEKLSKRAIIREGLDSGKKTWYEFQQINKFLNFEEEMIVYPNVSLGSNFTISKGAVIDMTGFIIPVNCRFLLSILNSQLFSWFMSKTAISRRGGYNEYKSQYILEFPLKNPSENDRFQFSEKADQMLALNKDLQEIVSKFQRALKREFDLEKLSKKIDNWYELEYADFLKELKKKKVELPLSQKAEWEEYFESEKAKAVDLKTQIDTTDKAIDEMVYDLYELTEEEREIVKNS